MAVEASIIPQCHKAVGSPGVVPLPDVRLSNKALNRMAFRSIIPDFRGLCIFAQGNIALHFQVFAIVENLDLQAFCSG